MNVDNMQNIESFPLLSIIIPVYNTARYLKRCLDSVLKQTYCNIEIIIVNDGSSDKSADVIKRYQEKDKRIIYIEHNKNKGLFHARLSGVYASKGDYLAHLDSDDYVSLDFYRSLIYNMINNNTDIAIGDTVNVNMNNELLYCNYAHSDLDFSILENEKLLDCYFKQEGANLYWHVIWNKVYKKEVWEKALHFLVKQERHLVAIEDLLFSTVLFYFANSISRVKNNAHYWREHREASTYMKNIKYKKIKKYIDDLITGFYFIEKFLLEKNILQKYLVNFLKLKSLYKYFCNEYINNSRCSNNEKKSLYSTLKLLHNDDEIIVFNDYFKNLYTPYNDKYEKIKEDIYNPDIKIISFDVFDTLVVRPFLEPADLFIMMDDYFRKITGGRTVVDFSVLRMESEKRARKVVGNEYEDINIDEIYNVLCLEYGVSDAVAETMKQLEVEIELKYCTARNSVFELYEMALHIGKEVICISDMYLHEDTVKNILNKNGYTKINKIFVSSEARVTKSSGNMYDFVVFHLNIKPNEILHIGDNYDADCLNAKKMGLNAIHYMKPQDVLFNSEPVKNIGLIFNKKLPFWQDNKESLSFFGVRVMIAMVAKYYFDNPYRVFNKDSDFNADPKLIGYSALGMYLYGIITWLIESLKEKKYGKVLFVSRDGYLPMEVYKIMKPYYKDLPDEEYLYISRESVILIAIQDDLDFYKLHELITWYNKSPLDILPYLKILFDIEENSLIEICIKNNIEIKEKFNNLYNYYYLINICKNKYFNKAKHDIKLEKLRNYFSKILEGNVCIFDIGYSAKPELYLSKLCNKKIDTYFINSYNDSGIKHAQGGEFKFSTFLDYKPVIVGFVDEVLISKMEGSCISYDLNGDAVKPVIDEYNLSYPEQFVLNNIQKSTLDFICDITNLFKFNISKLWHQSYYTSMLFWLFYFSSKENDRNIFSCFIFLDKMGNNTGSLVDKWSEMYDVSGQRTLDGYYYSSDLANKKYIKYIYMLLYDKKMLKIAFKEKLKKNKIMFCFFKNIYNILLKIKKYFK